MRAIEFIIEYNVPKTKMEYMRQRRDAIMQRMLGSNFSLRNVAAAASFTDDVLHKLDTPEGWTDSNGKIHHGDEPYTGKLGKVGTWPPPSDPMVGTPDPYAAKTGIFKQLMA